MNVTHYQDCQMQVTTSSINIHKSISISPNLKTGPSTVENSAFRMPVFNSHTILVTLSSCAAFDQFVSILTYLQNYNQTI